ncbi:MAG: DUF2130 domain-containing protein [Patescibacteria group bacterium]|nr:DUF2130 domain-containing protein [Patescibacteria group bacterium]
MNNGEQKIKCPKCGESISIDNVLTHQIGEKIRKEIEVEQKTKEVEIANKEKELEVQTIQLEEMKKNTQIEVNKKVAEKLTAEKIVLWKQAQIEAGKEKEAEKKMLEERLAEKDTKLREANEKELLLRKEKNKLEEEKRNFELEKQRQLDEEREKITEDANKKATEEQRFIIGQLKKQLTGAIKAKDDLSRKLEQGSQQTQGEVLELELEEILKVEFPYDEILPVPKGVSGADVVQKVKDNSGRMCGQIIWESKRTKAWSNGWIQKLKDDQRIIKADLAVIASVVLPEDIKGFVLRNGVWICDIKLVVALAVALRINLLNVSREREMSVGKNEKMEILYSYLTGVEFKQRVEAIVEAFSSMDQGLRKERMAYEKIWSEREKQIKKVITNTVGMYGDLSGLVALPQIKTLELPEGKDGDKK